MDEDIGRFMCFVESGVLYNYRSVEVCENGIDLGIEVRSGLIDYFMNRKEFFGILGVGVGDVFR